MRSPLQRISKVKTRSLVRVSSMGDVSAARIAIDIGRVEDSLELIAGEVIGRNLDDLDPARAMEGFLMV